jgi:hypothetical protein
MECKKKSNQFINAQIKDEGKTDDWMKEGKSK